MSIITDLEAKLQELLGKTPCKDDTEDFYYVIESARKKGVDGCLDITVSIYLKRCDSALLNTICQLKADTRWSFTIDSEKTDAHEIAYIATTTIESVCVSCSSSSGTDKEMKEVITDITLYNK